MNALALTIGLAGLSIGQSAWSATTYRWVDEQGRVHYSDTRPAQGAGQKQLDKQGREVAPPKPKPEAAAGKADPKQDKAASETQQRRDRALLSTYVNEAEIDLARDRALAIEQTTLKGLQTRLDNTKQRLDRLDGQIAERRKKGGEPPASMSQMKNEAQDEFNRLNDMVQRSTQVVESIRGRYEADKQRFRELKGPPP